MSYKILLIDDSITQLESFRIKLSRAGYEVITASDGEDGFQKVFSQAPDIILSDIMMPNLTGYQLCRLLKNNKETKDIPIILLTVLDKKIDKFWASKSGADKFLLKTTEFAKIEEIIKELLEVFPVSKEYKSKLLEKSLKNESIQKQTSIVFDELLKNLTLVNEFRDLSEFLPQEKVLVEKIFFLLNSFIDYNVAGIFFNTIDKNEKFILYLDINKNRVSNFLIEKIKRNFFTSIPNLPPFSIKDFGHEILSEKIENENVIISDSEFKSKVLLPIESEGRILGGMCLFGKNELNFAESKFYKTVVNELSTLFKMKTLYSERERLSISEDLRGLHNRRHFQNNIEREFIRTRRYPSKLSLALIDIDYFKQVNDTYGHQFGDYVLKEISNILVKSFRKTDMIYRYGGEELTVILTETSLENSVIPLERFRERIEKYPFSYNGQETRLTVSEGLGTNADFVQTELDLIECADKALYKAKQSGRNKVVMYSYDEFNDNKQPK